MDNTKEDDRSLMIGNGFSANHFSYKSLLDETDITEGEPLFRLFQSIGGYDFEAAMRSLADAAKVADIYGLTPQAASFRAEEVRLREQLVHAIRKIHPAHKEDIQDSIELAKSFLSNFSQFYTLNYDLLLYWIQLGGRSSDGFGLGEERDGLRGPFKTDAYCNTFNLHGGLHLFLDKAGDLHKRVQSGNGIIDAISTTILDKKILPLYVAEGTAVEKVSKINSVHYLRYCLDILRNSTGYLFIYGHSAKDNDIHIYDAIFKSKLKRVYFSVYKADETQMREFDSQLSRFQKLGGKKIPYTFYDAESAHIWGP